MQTTSWLSCPESMLGNAPVGLLKGNPELAALGQQAISEIDPAKRAELLKQIQVIMSTDSPFIPLAQFPKWMATREGLKGADHTDAYRIDLRQIYWE